MSLDDLAGPAMVEKLIRRGTEPLSGSSLRSRPPHPVRYSGLIDGELKLDHPKVVPIPVSDITIHRYNAFLQRVQ